MLRFLMNCLLLLPVPGQVICSQLCYLSFRASFSKLVIYKKVPRWCKGTMVIRDYFMFGYFQRLHHHKKGFLNTFNIYLTTTFFHETSPLLLQLTYFGKSNTSLGLHTSRQTFILDN